jgi:uncharacterized protein YcgL (UPF0745 family)
MGHHYSDMSQIPSNLNDFFSKPQPGKTMDDIARDLVNEQKIDTAAERIKEHKLGPTGQFPDGKLDENDEGEIAIGAVVFRGRVILNFGKPISVIGFTPQQAEELARDLLRKAREASL